MSRRTQHVQEEGCRVAPHREHHEHWGRGRLGSEGLKALLDRAEFSSSPAILETPKDFPGADRANLQFTRGLSRR